MVMGYATSEFPNFRSAYPDVGELIFLYRKLTEEYEGLLEGIDSMQSQLDKYISETEAKIPGWIDSRVSIYVAQMEATRKEILDALAAQSVEVNGVLQDYQKQLNTQLNNQNENIRQMMLKHETWVTEQIQANQNYVQLMIDRYNVRFDSELSKWESRLNQVVTDTNNNDAMFLKELQQVTESIKNMSGQFNSRMEELEHELHVWYYAHTLIDREWTREQIAEFKADVQEMIDALIASGEFNAIWNNVSCTVTTVGQVFADLWKYALNAGGFTVMEWDTASWITCEMFDKRMDINSSNFYVHGKELLGYQLHKATNMFSPVTGKFVPVSVAINDVFNALNQYSISAGEYDAGNVPAGNYDDYKVTAGEYVGGGFNV